MRQAIPRQPSDITKNSPKKFYTLFRHTIFGCIVIIALLMMLSLITYHPEDSAWSRTIESHTIHNWLGAKGANFSDIVLTTIGQAAWLIPVLFVAYGYRLLCQQAYKDLDAETIIIRIVGILIGLLSIASLMNLYHTGDHIIDRGGAIGQFIGTLLTHSVEWLQWILPDNISAVVVSKAILFFFLFITTMMATGCGPLAWIDFLGAICINCFMFIYNILMKKEPHSAHESSDLSSIEELMSKETPEVSKPSFLASLLGRQKTKTGKVDVRKTFTPSKNIEDIKAYFFKSHPQDQETDDAETSELVQKSEPTLESTHNPSLQQKVEPSFASQMTQSNPSEEFKSQAQPSKRNMITPKFEVTLDEDGQPKTPAIFMKRPTIKSSPQSPDAPVEDEESRFKNLNAWIAEEQKSVIIGDDVVFEDDDNFAVTSPNGSMFSQSGSQFASKPSPTPSEALAKSEDQDYEQFLEDLKKYHKPSYDLPDETTISDIDLEESFPTIEIIPEEKIELPDVSQILINETPERIEPTLSEDDFPDIAWEAIPASEVIETPEPEIITHKAVDTPIVPQPTPTIAIATPKPVQNPQRDIHSENKRAELLKHFPMAGQVPSLNLLGDPPPVYNQYDVEELNEMAELIEEQLHHFSIKVTVANIEPGPVVTRFELDLAPGVKVAQINNLEKDLARGLSVTSVRVVDIIPGTSFVGLEIPNKKREIVYFKSGLESKEYQEATHPLTLILGKSISGDTVLTNLAKMPHLLVAGTTGSGKSVGVNTMLLSMLFKAKPEELRLILIDPKMLELSVYNDIPHLLIPVITDMKESANALRWCVAEMERRYMLMSQLKVRNIAGFNQKVEDAINAGEPLIDPLWRRSEHVSDTENPPLLEKLPFIVVVIDEFADMMMLVGKKCEELIARLAQKARASGIHLILATQRPSVDVITGLIKANIPTRIAFQVSSKIDSRTIIDQQGAESLLGHGDMLFMPPGTSLPIRVHGAFVDDHEVNKVVEFLKLTGEPNYIEDILQEPTEAIPGLSPEASGVAASPSDEKDPLFDEAVKLVVESRRASISYIQRRLRVGYQRAARLMEEMEELRIVTPPQPNGNRDVLMSADKDEF